MGHRKCALTSRNAPFSETRGPHGTRTPPPRASSNDRQGVGEVEVSGDGGGRTIVVVTHNPEIAEIANRAIDLRDGAIVALVSYDRPRHSREVDW